MGDRKIDQAWLVDLLEANYQLAIAESVKDGRTNALKVLRRIEKRKPT